jgi:tetratricopeptide (TPR) repeat protein
MQKSLSLIVVLWFSVGYAFGQKAKLQTAINFYKPPYQQFDKAKEAIDEAVNHEQTKGMAKTWYYKGLIYSALFSSEKYGSLCNNCLVEANDAFKKAMEIDPNNEWAGEIQLNQMQLMSQVFNKGVAQFKEGKYAEALADFEMAQAISPNDTATVLNSAYSAERAGDKAKAKQYYGKLVSMRYQDDKTYAALSNLYREEGNMDKALEVIRDGRTAMPESLNLMLAEINILLSTGKSQEATTALDAAIQKDPKNPSLYMALGSTFDNMANPKGADGKEKPKPAQYNDYMSRAEAAYKKGLEIQPDNYEINYNLGAMYFNQGADMANSANQLMNNTEFEKAKVKYEEKFKAAAPYLEKSLESNPRKTDDDQSLYQGTLLSLKQLYVRLNETEKYNRIKNLLEQK